MHWAAEGGSIDCAQWLIKRKIDSPFVSWFVSNKNGHTPLHMAARKGHDKFCRWVLQTAGCEALQQKDNDKLAPMDLAMIEGYTKLAQWLKDYKCCDTSADKNKPL